LIDFSGNIPAVIEQLLITFDVDKVFVLADSNTVSIVDQLKIKSLREENICVIPAGEQHKTLAQAAHIWEFLSDNRASRKSLLINVGGGMITDLGGFCGSTYMRGIRTLNIPTSLLAMVDASLGGKTGINHQHFKNQIGTFHNPIATCINIQFLYSLPKLEFINAWAEIMKHGIIDGGALWSTIKSGLPNEDSESWLFIVKENVRIKSEIVQKDPLESGLRQKLNFGHSIGHALESCYLAHKDFICHGQAVAAGIVIESFISNQLNLLTSKHLQEITQVVDSSFERLSISPDWFQQLLNYIKVDKKNFNDQIIMVLPQKPGHLQLNVPVKSEQIISALTRYVEAAI
jgi:3-dehydroquinate synthase